MPRAVNFCAAGLDKRVGGKQLRGVFTVWQERGCRTAAVLGGADPLQSVQLHQLRGLRTAEITGSASGIRQTEPAPRAGPARSVVARKGIGHALFREGPSGASGAGRLSRSGPGVSDRPDENRIVQPRDRRGHAAGGRSDRAARHQGPRDREGHFLRSVSLHHRLQGRPPVLPGVEKGCPAATGGDGRLVRHLPALRLHGLETPWVRHGDGGRPAGRGLYGIHGHRHGGRCHQSTGHPGPGEDPADQQHPGRLRRHLPHRHRLRRVVPARDRATIDAGQPARGGEEITGRDFGRRRAGARHAFRFSDLRGSGVPRDQWKVREQDRRGTRGPAQGRARLHLAGPSRRVDRRGRARHGHPSGGRGRGDDPHRASDGAGRSKSAPKWTTRPSSTFPRSSSTS